MPITLRPYQQEMKAAIYRAWQEGHQNVLLVMPTGLGKTKTFSDIAIDRAVLPAIGKMPTAIMVHRKELVQQISLTLAEEGIQHNIIAPRPVISGIVAAQRLLLKRQFYDYNSVITVISVDTLNARIEKHRKWAQSIRLWITDEAAHLLSGNKWGKAVGYFPNAIGLGVTATPERLDKRGLGRHADGVFDVMVQGPSTRWGIENGFLSPYKIAVPASDYRSFLKRKSGDADFTKEEMAYAASQSHIVGDAVVNYQKFAAGKQAIYFVSDSVTGKKMEKEFCDAGFKAKLLTAETPDKERLESLIAFREKKIKVLLNIDLFDEGLDVPGIEVVGMCRPTMSISKYLQMCGRGLRPMPGKEYCLIIDHVGNVKEHLPPDWTRRWTLDRIIRRRDKTNLVRICSNVLCNSPYERYLTECPYCKEPVQSAGGGGGGGRVSPEQVDGDLELLDPQTLAEMYGSCQLEDPADVAKRVSFAVNAAAGLKAMKAQQERIATQKELVEVIAQWAGQQKSKRHLTDRQIHKLFYLEMDMTITEALSEPRADMLKTIEYLKGSLSDARTG